MADIWWTATPRSRTLALPQMYVEDELPRLPTRVSPKAEFFRDAILIYTSAKANDGQDAWAITHHSLPFHNPPRLDHRSLPTTYKSRTQSLLTPRSAPFPPVRPVRPAHSPRPIHSAARA